MAKETVLLIDDEEGIREALDEFLQGEGYEVTLAENGEKALALFSKNDFSLVITDMMMPGMGGIETMRRMKKAKPDTKVLIVSGLPDPQAFEGMMAVSQGTAEGFVSKPFKPADLRNALAKLKEREVVGSFGLPVTCAMPRKASILVVDDEEDYLEFVTAYLTLLGHEVKGTESGHEALSLMEENTFDVVVTDHVTVGSAATPIMQLVRDKQPGTRIIVMSGIPTLDDAKRSYLAGAQCYLSKPFPVDDLREAVQACMEPPASVPKSKS